LINIVERAVILCRGAQIESKHLPLNAEIPQRHKPSTPVSDTELKQLLQRFEGKRSEVAAHLGIDRTTLWRWLKKHHIE